jgi:hypothetical protein
MYLVYGNFGTDQSWGVIDREVLQYTHVTIQCTVYSMEMGQHSTG